MRSVTRNQLRDRGREVAHEIAWRQKELRECHAKNDDWIEKLQAEYEGIVTVLNRFMPQLHPGHPDYEEHQDEFQS